ncbi:MAG: caspase family protein [Armatimonadetes bacterium]|nr:caspase family protein [Armatimonadota bacterium]
MRRLLCILALASASGLALGQAWSDHYESALQSAGRGDWTSARESFLAAVALRPEDQSRPTTLPSPVPAPKRWRDGSPYSPNFGAAYCGYRQGLKVAGDNGRQLLAKMGEELEVLLAKNQHSPQTYYFLTRIYSEVRDVARLDVLEATFIAMRDSLTWKVDTSFVSPEEVAAITALTPTKSGATSGRSSPPTRVISAADLGTGGRVSTNIGAAQLSGTEDTLAGRVQVVPTKFALIIGNSESRMEEHKLSFAGANALLIREALVQHAGYDEANVDIVMNATANQIRVSAEALAERIGNDGTVLIYFTGAGFNVGGKDYYAGVDAESPLATSNMVAVSDVYGMFLARGARIFAFSEASRKKVDGRFFGMEIPMVGAIAQSQATIGGEEVFGIIEGGKEIGLYSRAFASILFEFRSNQVPITEFAWQVYNSIRSGGVGTTGGGSQQTPTLPVLINLATDARF